MYSYNSFSHYDEQVLVYPKTGNKVLLIFKKRGLGEGLFNGPGGKVNVNETAEEAAIREVEEEIGIKLKNLDKVATLFFINNEVEDKILVHVYLSDAWEGEPKETDEAKPFFFTIDQLPYDKMWEDDFYWLPLVLKGEKIYAVFKFKNWRLSYKKIYVLKEVNNE